MPKYVRRKTSYRKKPAPRRSYKPAVKYTKKRYAKRSSRRVGSGRYAKKMQDQTFMYTKKKYTEVIPIIIRQGDIDASATISIMGGKNSTSPLATYTVGSVDPDGMLSNDME